MVREAYDSRALRGMFGNGDGNLYEGPCCVPRSRLAQRVREHPVLNARFLARLNTVVREVWSDAAMQARAEAVRTVIESAPRDDARVRVELKDFQARFPLQLELFRGRRVLLEGLLPSEP